MEVAEFKNVCVCCVCLCMHCMHICIHGERGVGAFLGIE